MIESHVRACFRDCKFAVRFVRSNLGVVGSLIGVLSAAVGLATLTAALTAPFLVQPLPYPNPDTLRVVMVERYVAAVDSPPSLGAWMRDGALLEAAGYLRANAPLRVQIGDHLVPLRIVYVTESFVPLLVGRSSGCREMLELPCAIITSAGKAKIQGTNADAIGGLLTTSDGPIRVGDVLPITFRFPEASPTSLDALVIPVGDRLWMSSVTELDRILVRGPAKLTPEQLAKSLESWHHTAESLDLSVTSLDEFLTRDVRRLALGAAGLACFLIGTATANASVVLFCIGAQRRRDVAIQRFLGASRTIILRGRSVETGCLAVCIFGCSVLLAWLLLSVLRPLLPFEYLALGTPALTWPMIALAMVLSLVLLTSATVLAALALGSMDGHRSNLLPPRQPGRRLQFTSLLIQSALASILLSGGVLLGRSFYKLFSQESGLAESAVLVSVSYPTQAAGGNLVTTIYDVVASLERMAGVQAAGALAGPFLERRFGSSGGVRVASRSVSATVKRVTTGFLDAAGLELKRGRRFVTTDERRNVAIVNEAFVAAAWTSGVDPLGTEILLGGVPHGVVGVSKNALESSLARPPEPVVYRPLTPPLRCDNCEIVVHYVVKQSQFGAVGAIEDTVAGLGSANVLESGRIEARLLKSVQHKVLGAAALGLFAGSALLVCLVGLDGAVRFMLTTGARDTAVRAALGAGSYSAALPLLTNTIAALGSGLAVGLLGGWAVARLLAAYAFETPLTLWYSSVPACLTVLAAASVVVHLRCRRLVTSPPFGLLRQ